MATTRKFNLLKWALLTVSLAPALHADQPYDSKTYTAERTNPHAPYIDGTLDEPCWRKGRWADGFIQREPYEGKSPSQDTAFKILYDDKNLYVAIRAHDTAPGRIERRVTRRDTRDGDRVAIALDSYFDHRTAFVFDVNAAGVKSDYLISENGENEDDGWDPVWRVAVDVGDKGWTVEMEIPFSQLRFGSATEQVWGLQVWRWLHRREELSGWQFIPKDAPGSVHLYGQLRGITGVSSHRQLELLPYVVGQRETFEKEEGNPFRTGRSQKGEMGLDGKLGLTSDLILNFTVNPDFGQVEADPSVVNLTTHETFFTEKRPFFVEGRNILDFPLMGGDGDFSQDNLFYSRRIGRSPQHAPETAEHEYLRAPDATSILGAFKLTGKTRSGLSIGALQSFTARERAEIDSGGERRHETVEPFSSYSIARIQKDWDRGNTILGGMWTATHRRIDDEQLELLHRTAITGGVDFQHAWKDKTYTFSVKSVFSRVQGSPEALRRTQESSVRYFQRPDAKHVSVDPDRTSLSGHGGTVAFAKGGEGHFRFSLGTTWRSPGLELNDLGFLRGADRILQWFWVGYRIWKPFGSFRRLNINFNQWKGWDFSGENLFDGGNINASAQLKNYWGFGAGINRQGASLSTNMLRGGPALQWPGGWGNWFNVHTDSRKKLRFNFGGWNYWDDEASIRTKEFWVGGTYRPSNALAISIEPNIGSDKRELQYVSTEQMGLEDRFVFAHIDQKTVSITLRVNYSITPNLSLQYYGQPFISAGDYTRFKRITDPRAGELQGRFHTFDDQHIRYDPQQGIYNVDEAGRGAVSYSFENPAFNFRQFRSNLVLRWEYSPGSTLYLVWSQERTGEEVMGRFHFRRDLTRLFDTAAHNVFLVKFNHWLSF